MATQHLAEIRQTPPRPIVELRPSKPKEYGHDYAGNREWREDLKASGGHSKGFDEVYTYDGLNRLKTLDRDYGPLANHDLPPVASQDSVSAYE